MHCTTCHYYINIKDDKKKLLVDKCDDYPIPKQICEIRFTSLHKELINLLCIEKKVNILRADVREADHELVIDIPLDFGLVSAMHKISEQVYPLIKYFEKTDGLTPPSFLPKMINLLTFALTEEPVGDHDIVHTRWISELKISLAETMLNYLTGYTTHRNDRTEFQKASGVPNRCTDIVLASTYLNFPESLMSCWTVLEALKTTQHPRKDVIIDIVKQEMVGKWKIKAKNFISAQHRLNIGPTSGAPKQLSSLLGTCSLFKTRTLDPGFQRHISNSNAMASNTLDEEFLKYENFYCRYIECKKHLKKH